MIMLDTTACIDFLNGDESIKKAVSSSNYDLILCTISIYEVYIGLERTKRKISEKRYNTLYKSWVEFVSGIEIFPIGAKEAEIAANIYDTLECKGAIIEDPDILIAATMLNNRIKKILTKNAKHFEKIEGLEIVNY